MTRVIERDVIVVGAGPAGSICAAYLAKAGLDVLLLDKELFPAEKPCGDIMCEGIVQHINRLEMLEIIDKASSCIRRIKLISNSGMEKVVPFECYTMPRTQLDRTLIDTALSWGVEVRQGCRVVNVIRELGYIRGVVVKEKGVEHEIRCRLLIGADGSNSTIGKLTGNLLEKSSGIWMGMSGYFSGVTLEKKLATEQYDAGGIIGFDDAGYPGYSWIMPSGSSGVKDGFCNVGMMVLGRDDYSPKDLLDKMNRWIGSDGPVGSAMKNAVQHGNWKMGKLPDSTQARRPAFDGLIMIGDAASDTVTKISETLGRAMNETLSGKLGEPLNGKLGESLGGKLGEPLGTLPLFNDGLSAAANTAKRAADAATAAFLENDFSAEYLTEKMEEGVSRGLEYDEMKKIRTLFMESLKDPNVLDILISDY